MTAVEGGRSWRGAALWEWREGQERFSKWLEWGGSDTTLCAVRGPLSWSCCPLSQAKEKGRKASKWALEQLSRGRTGLWALCCWAQRTFSYHWTLISFIPTSSRRKPNTSFNYRKGWASPGLVQKRLCCEVLELDPEHHWAASPWGTEPFQGWWGVLQNQIFAVSKIQHCCLRPAVCWGGDWLLLLNIGFGLLFLTIEDKDELVSYKSTTFKVSPRFWMAFVI